MKLSKLIERLGREIDEKHLRREELLELVVSLTDELRELDQEQATVVKLARRYDGNESDARRVAPRSPKAQPTVVPRSAKAPVEVKAEVEVEAVGDAEVEVDSSQDDRPLRTLHVEWPIGPHYHKQFKAKAREAWPLYKLGTADWYLSTLREISASVKKLDRLLGVEMAIDGALQALCSAFEAALYTLASALELDSRLPGTDRAAEIVSTWRLLSEQANEIGVDLVAAGALLDALEANDPEAPTGWLAQLFLLRQRSTQHDLLIRHWVVGREAPVVCIDVPAIGPVPPLEYLEESRDRLEMLLKAMLDDHEALHRRRLYATKERRSLADNELPDLLRRAGILP
jgi:hypothetical protein